MYGKCKGVFGLQWNVVVLASVVVPEEPNSVCDTEVVVDEAGEEGVCLIVT
jgi:hypothetical protein